jgi:NADH-quinone oxidoreductase subunit G
MFNLGVDEVDVPGAFRIYLGHHGDRGARAADIILPAAAYTEKAGTWVNLEGRVQRGSRATFPPGEARDDWTILRALSAVLGTPLPYDDLRSLRARIAGEWPHLASEGLTPAPWVAPAAGTAAPSGPLTVAAREFYRSNAIARASATMAECVREIVQADEPRLEAAE